MIADRDTNVVFVADTLAGRFPEVYFGLRAILTEHGIPLRTIPGTRDIWCRDYMPIQVAADRFVQFRYAPAYLTGKYRPLRADGEIGPTLPWIKTCILPEIVLDGGNFVGCRDKAILTERIYSENPTWRKAELVAELASLLEVNEVIVIPAEPGDVTGHADGIVRFLDEKTVCVGEARTYPPEFHRRLFGRLKAAGLDVIELPYRPTAGSSQGMPSAVGNYVNALETASVTVVPAYGFDSDGIARSTLQKAMPASAVCSFECNTIAKLGGVIRCASWCVRLT